jgi:hypothetical protein
LLAAVFPLLNLLICAQFVACLISLILLVSRLRLWPRRRCGNLEVRVLQILRDRLLAASALVLPRRMDAFGRVVLIVALAGHLLVERLIRRGWMRPVLIGPGWIIRDISAVAVGLHPLEALLVIVICIHARRAR